MDNNNLTLTIYSSCFELDEFNEKIGEFCEVSNVPPTAKRNIELVMEELVRNNIAEFIAHNNDMGLPITVNIEHIGISPDTDMTVIYGGERYDPIYDGDELSAMVIKKLASVIKYSFDDGNRLVLKFR